jgi:hypothetical protein
MDPQEVKQILFRISEHLRIAIKDSNAEEAHRAFEMTTTMLDEAEGFAGRGVLTLELVQYLVDLGIEADLSRWSPAVNNLISDCLVFGRSDQLFTEVMTTLMRLNADETSELIAELIEAAIDAAVFSESVSLDEVIDLWWQEFQSLLVREETLEAINSFRTDSNGEEDDALRILTLQIESVFSSLHETESLLDELSSDRQFLQEILLTCRRNIGLNRRMALKVLLSETDSESIFDALIALTVFFEVQLPDIDDSSELSNSDSLENSWAMPALDSNSQTIPHDDEEMVTTLSNGITVSWTVERKSWVGDDDSEWMVDDQSPHVWMPIEVWRVMYPGKKAKYVRPQSAPPARPDRQLSQDLYYGDQGKRNQVLKLMEKKKYDRADSIQLSHFKSTGRWLLGNPPVEGWYPDPLQRFGMRFWTNMHWTEFVSDNGGEPTIDLNFPTDEDMSS